MRDTAMLTAEEILTVPTVLSAGLPAHIVAQLPEQTPPAPWHSNIEMALWGFRATASSGAAVPDGLTASLPVGGCGFIRYLDGAVGAYDEVLATPRCVRVPGRSGVHGHVPFIAVDSVRSIHGGRTNWALPKVPARFSGAPGTDSAVSAVGADWSIGASITRYGPWLPFRAAGSSAQPWPDGGVRAFTSRFRGRVRLAVITVTVSGPETLTRVLPGGRHLGIVVRGSVDVGAPS